VENWLGNVRSKSFAACQQFGIRKGMQRQQPAVYALQSTETGSTWWHEKGVEVLIWKRASQIEYANTNA
jgi:hypothetical protein